MIVALIGSAQCWLCRGSRCHVCMRILRRCALWRCRLLRGMLGLMRVCLIRSGMESGGGWCCGGVSCLRRWS